MKWSYDDGGRAKAGYVGHPGDCVCRAIAIATGKPYQEVYGALNEVGKSMRQTRRVRASSARTWVARPVYERYLKSIGWRFVPTMKIGSGCRVHLNDGELPQGRIICRLSKHLVAVIDGVIHGTSALAAPDQSYPALAKASTQQGIEPAPDRAVWLRTSRRRPVSARKKFTRACPREIQRRPRRRPPNRARPIPAKPEQAAAVRRLVEPADRAEGSQSLPM